MGFVNAALSPIETQACLSACGLIAGTTSNECKQSDADNYCSNLSYVDGVLTHNLGLIPVTQRLTPNDALAIVMASENNCFAMFYEDERLRLAKAYCAENNVCPNLFWNKVAPGAEASVKTFSLDTGSSDDSANRLSPVLCDYAASKKTPIVEDHGGRNDPCGALCSLSHTEEECNLVMRQGATCMRLFWTDASRSATAFSVRDASGDQIAVKVLDAHTLLRAPDNSCEGLCQGNANCQRAESHCSDNRVCHGLQYFGAISGAGRKVCYQQECDAHSRKSVVFCLKGDDHLSKDPSSNSGTNSGNTRADGSDSASNTGNAKADGTKDQNDSQIATGVVALVFAILVSML